MSHKREHEHEHEETIGRGLLAVGVSATVAANIYHFSPHAIAVTLTLTGVLLLCYTRLAVRSAASNQTYYLGHEQGHEQGYEEGRRDAESHPRPTVAPIETRRCCKCGGRRDDTTGSHKILDRSV